MSDQNTTTVQAPAVQAATIVANGTGSTTSSRTPAATPKPKPAAGKPAAKTGGSCHRCGFVFTNTDQTLCNVRSACDKRVAANSKTVVWPGVARHPREQVAEGKRPVYPHRRPAFRPASTPARPAR